MRTAFTYNFTMTMSFPECAAIVDRRWRLAGAAFCLLMMGIHVASAMHFAGLADTWRDAYWATLIAHGERFPLFGPPINQTFELGPWWFYLLALPMWLTGRVLAVAIFVQLLAAAKYFLAWRLGTRVIDARFGLACAVSLAFTGWSIADICFPSHPAVVETCVILLAYAVLRGWQHFAAIEATLFGIAAAACLHAHPTTLLYVAFGGAALLYRHRSLRAVGRLGVSLAIVLISLLPPWFDPTPVFAEASQPLKVYWQNDFGANVLARVPRLLAGLYFGGAWNGFLTMTLWNTATAKLAWSAYCVCLALAGAGVVLLHSRGLRWMFGAALAFVVVQIVFLALVRSYTPIWIVPSCMPAAAAGLALGWYGWLASNARARVVVGSAALAFYAALSIAPFGLFLRDVHSVRVMKHGNPLINMSDSDDQFQTVPVPATSIRSLDALGAELCDPVTLHARFGVAMEHALAVPARNACGRWPELRFGGAAGVNHIAGISVRAAQAIGLVPDRTVGDMALYTHIRAVAPPEGAAAMRLQRMQVTINLPSRQDGPIEFSFDAAPGDIVLLTKRSPLMIDSMTANNVPAKLVFTDGNGFFYICTSCGTDSAPVRWRMRATGIEQYLDLIILLKRRH